MPHNIKPFKKLLLVMLSAAFFMPVISCSETDKQSEFLADNTPVEHEGVSLKGSQFELSFSAESGFVQSITRFELMEPGTLSVAISKPGFGLGCLPSNPINATLENNEHTSIKMSLGLDRQKLAVSAGKYVLRYEFQSVSSAMIKSSNHVLGCSIALKNNRELFVDGRAVIPWIRFESAGGERHRPVDVQVIETWVDSNSAVPISRHSNHPTDNHAKAIFYLSPDNSTRRLGSIKVREFGATLSEFSGWDWLNRGVALLSSIGTEDMPTMDLVLLRFGQPTLRNDIDYGGERRGDSMLVVADVNANNLQILDTIFHEYLHAWLENSVENWTAIPHDLGEGIPEFFGGVLSFEIGASDAEI